MALEPRGRGPANKQPHGLYAGLGIWLVLLELSEPLRNVRGTVHDILASRYSEGPDWSRPFGSTG